MVWGFRQVGLHLKNTLDNEPFTIWRNSQTVEGTVPSARAPMKKYQNPENKRCH